MRSRVAMVSMWRSVTDDSPRPGIKVLIFTEDGECLSAVREGMSFYSLQSDGSLSVTNNPIMWTAHPTKLSISPEVLGVSGG